MGEGGVRGEGRVSSGSRVRGEGRVSGGSGVSSDVR